MKAIERYLDDHGAELRQHRALARSRSRCTSRRASPSTAASTSSGASTPTRSSIVDFKSTDRAQDEDVTRDQLHVYAVGYEELTGERADLIEVLNLDEKGKSVREEVNGALISSVRTRIADAGTALRTNDLRPHAKWCKPCETCDFAAMCPTRRPIG